LRDYKLIRTKINYLKLLKLKKMANVKKESTSNGGGMVSGLIIVACIGVGVLIWKFIMGNPRILKEEIMKDPLNTLGQVYHGVLVPVLLGMLLMVLVFSIEFFNI
jgi:biopolymer transport protein ExbB